MQSFPTFSFDLAGLNSYHVLVSWKLFNILQIKGLPLPNKILFIYTLSLTLSDNRFMSIKLDITLMLPAVNVIFHNKFQSGKHSVGIGHHTTSRRVVQVLVDACQSMRRVDVGVHRRGVGREEPYFATSG